MNLCAKEFLKWGGLLDGKEQKFDIQFSSSTETGSL